MNFFRMCIVGVKDALHIPLTNREKAAVADVVKRWINENNNRGLGYGHTCRFIATNYSHSGSVLKFWRGELDAKYGPATYIDAFEYAWNAPHSGPGSMAASMKNRLDFCDELIKKYGV